MMDDIKTILTELTEFLIVGICVLTALFIAVSTVLIVGTRLSVPGDLSQIEQLRSDVARLTGEERQNAVGQAVRTNQMIRSKQTYRKLWWSKPYVPKQWESVELIDVERSK